MEKWARWNEQDEISCNIHGFDNFLASLSGAHRPQPLVHLSPTSAEASILPSKKVKLPHGEKLRRQGKGRKQPLKHSRLVYRLYEFFIRQTNSLIIMFIGAGFFLFRCQSLCAFLKMFLFGFLSSSHSDLLSCLHSSDGNGASKGGRKVLRKIYVKCGKSSFRVVIRKLQGFVISMAEKVVAPIERPESCSISRIELLFTQDDSCLYCFDKV